MKVSLLSKIIPESVRVPLVIWLRKKGISTAIQSILYAREARSLKSSHASNSILSEEELSKMKDVSIDTITQAFLDYCGDDTDPRTMFVLKKLVEHG